MKDIEAFLDSIVDKNEVWLLESRPGMFAMLEDGDGDSYVPIWASEADAQKQAAGEWSGYTTTSMSFPELEVWLGELSHDDIDVIIAPEGDEEKTALPSAGLRKWVKQHAVGKFNDDSDEPDDDFDDTWAQPWPEEI